MLDVGEDMCLLSPPWKGCCRMEEEDHRMEEDRRMEEDDTSQTDSLSPASSMTSAHSEDGSCSSPPPASSNNSGGGGSVLLPPCRVCGEKASGFHYGVNTCEACKGFFRRSLQRKDKKYKCSGGGRCQVGPGKRNSCPSCRYNKCLAVGMSKGAIKTGRYTHQKRTQDILEVKRLQQQQQSSTPPVPSDSSPSCSSASPSFSASPSSAASSLSSPEAASPQPCSFQMEPEEMEKMIKEIIDSHNALMVSHDFMPENMLDQKAKEYAEQYAIKQQMFGNLDLLPPEQYEEIYRATGIDIDNRQAMMKFFASNMEIGIRRFINFAKTIPGFTNLPIEDQANLVKASRFEYWFFGNFRGFFSQHKVAVMPSGKCLHVDEIRKIWDQRFLETVFSYSQALQKLNLTSEETVILKAVVVMFRDRCDLKAPEQVEKIQWQLVQCLMYLFKKNNRNANRMFAQITNHLMSARMLTEWNFTLARQLHLWQAVRDSPLLLEILSM